MFCIRQVLLWTWGALEVRKWLLTLRLDSGEVCKCVLEQNGCWVVVPVAIFRVELTNILVSDVLVHLAALLGLEDVVPPFSAE